MRLGYQDKPIRVRARRPGFNEAEAHAPRIPYTHEFGGGRASGFNEAEAHAPRIPVLSVSPGLPPAGFNEAEAHAPRIRRAWRMKKCNRKTASMRPRRMRLGYNPHPRRRHRTRRGSFNEAEAHAPRIHSGGRSPNHTTNDGVTEAEAHAPRIPGKPWRPSMTWAQLQ